MTFNLNSSLKISSGYVFGLLPWNENLFIWYTICRESNRQEFPDPPDMRHRKWIGIETLRKQVTCLNCFVKIVSWKCRLKGSKRLQVYHTIRHLVFWWNEIYKSDRSAKSWSLCRYGALLPILKDACTKRVRLDDQCIWYGNCAVILVDAISGIWDPEVWGRANCENSRSHARPVPCFWSPDATVFMIEDHFN